MMEVKLIKLDRDFLDTIPHYEEWKGVAGHDFYNESCFVILNNGIVQIPLKPKKRVGSNYAYSEEEVQKGESYLSSIKKYFAEGKIPFPVVILQREFSDWHGQEPVDGLTIIVVQ